MTAQDATSIRAESVADQVSRMLAGNRRALARLMTLVDSMPDSPDSMSWIDRLPTDRRALHVGITGAAGAGKSTLAGAMVAWARKQGKSIAVLASDPVSPFTGGALLGDRVRMDYDPGDSQVFIRSLSARGEGGGLSPSTGPMLRLCDAFGFDIVLVETVGAGQDQLAVREYVDVLLLVVTPAGGDEIQWEKAGVMEAVDLVVVNKADLPGADGIVAGMRAMLELVPNRQGRTIPILKAVASKGEGLIELWAAIERAAASPSLGGLRSSMVLAEARRRLTHRLQRLLATGEGQVMLQEVHEGRRSVADGGEWLVEQLFQRHEDTNR